MLIPAEALIVSAPCASPEQAMELLGRKLEECGFAAPGCAALFAAADRRFPCVFETIAVPHLGEADADKAVLQGGAAALLRLPEPLDWYGTPVSLVIALALPRRQQPRAWAAIAALARDPQRLAAIRDTERPSDVMALVNTAVAVGRPAMENGAAGHFDAEQEVDFIDPNGLHARPAAKLTALAAKCPGTSFLIANGKKADLNSVGALMALGISGPMRLKVAATGPDAALVVERVVRAIAAGLERQPEPPHPADKAEWPTPAPSASALVGVAAAPGIGIAPLWRFGTADPELSELPESVAGADEHSRLEAAWHAAAEQLKREITEQRQRHAAVSAAILEAHLALLQDEELRQQARQGVADGQSAGLAWRNACKLRARSLRESGSQRIAERASDYRDIARRVLAMLHPEHASEAVWPEGDFIVAATDLTPSQTMRLPPGRVVGLVTAEGGPTAHTAIVARALGIPAVVALGDALTALPARGETVILNGSAGFLEPNPTPEQLEQAQRAATALTARQRQMAEQSLEQAVMRDGTAVEVAANISASEEAQTAMAAGADGIGLLRTEIQVQDFSTAPEEDLLVAQFAAIAAALNGREILVRTYDIGADKPVAFMPMTPEGNPFLGLRGIRLCLAYPEIFRTQLRAILRAFRDHGLAVKILLPMVATLDELREAQRRIRAAAVELEVPVPPVGVMIEVPSVIWQIDAFAAEADFFSIGTNDLTQYILAMDRQHPRLAKQADARHPAVVRAIAAAAAGARRAGRWIGVCGNMAADPIGAALLLGLGVDELSVGAPAVAETKALVRAADPARLKQLAQQAQQCATTAEVLALYAGR